MTIAESPVDVPLTAAAEFAHKHNQVRTILAEAGVDGVVLESPTTLSWMLCGARTHISLAAPPIAKALVTADSVTVFTTNNESARLVAEELPASVEVVSRPWFEALPALPGVSEAALADELRAARRSLLAPEVERYAALGADVAVVLGDVARTATPADSEFSLAAAISAGIVGAGAEALVVLVAGAERIGHRHPLPTHAPIGRRAMLVACARRHGLIANITRWVRFGAPTLDETDAEARILEVEADAFEALAPGASLDDVYATIRESYARQGFGSDEWRNHHQGGAAGYAGRDPRFSQENDVIALEQAFAINPSAPGVKVEDTVLLTASGIRVLTFESAWPVVPVRGLPRPAVLER